MADKNWCHLLPYFRETRNSEYLYVNNYENFGRIGSLVFFLSKLIFFLLLFLFVAFYAFLFHRILFWKILKLLKFKFRNPLENYVSVCPA